MRSREEQKASEEGNTDLLSLLISPHMQVPQVQEERRVADSVVKAESLAWEGFCLLIVEMLSCLEED